MPVTIRQFWDDFVFKSMSHMANERGGLFANGVIAYDTSPIFTQGDTRHRVPLLNDLDTVLGADDQRLVDGTDLTVKSIDGGNQYAPIVYRGDSFGQPLTEQVKTGLAAIRRYSPGIALRNLNMMEKRLISVTNGAFGSGGPLASSHVYGDGTGLLKVDTPKWAKATVAGEAAGALNILVVNSLMEADLTSRGLLSYPQLVSASNPNAYATGDIPFLGGARIVVNDRLCTLVEHAFTADNSTDVITTTAAHGFVEDDPVIFTGSDLPAGITAGTTYYVIATGLTTTAFKISATVGGSALNFTDDGTGTMTVSGRQYYSYLLGQRAYYTGIQRSLNVTQFEKHLDGGKKDVIYWTVFYAPSIDGISYTDTTVNPTDTNLETGSNWAASKEAHEIKIIRLYNKLS